jgi:small-conductance mechanosensitive channel
MPQSIDKALDVIGVVLMTVIGIRFITSIIIFSIENYWLKDTGEEKSKLYRGLLPAIKTVIWALGLIFLLDNLGFKVSTVIAGLGIGGIAVAMASQAVLGDLFSYFAILTDRPFEVGDFIIVGDFMGSIEHIGLKTTRVKSLSGEQLVFSNTDLTSSRIRNYKRMERRRIVFKFGVTYQTPVERLREIPAIVRSIISDIGGADCDRSHFFGFGDSSLDFETVYFVATGDYNKYMDIQQAINLDLASEFEERGIDFAYPTRTIFLENTGREPNLT